MAVKWRMHKFYLIKIKWGTWHDVNADRRIDGTHFYFIKINFEIYFSF